MRRIDMFPWVTVLLGCVVLAASCFSKQEAHAVCPFEIKISSAKAQCFVFEPIFVQYQIRNTSDTTVCFVLDRAKEFFNIRDQEGRGYHNTELSEYLFCPDTLKANQAIDGWEDIRERYRMDRAGSYVCFNNFHGCSSNVLDIEVVQPAGEEKEALNLYLDTRKLHWCKDKDPKKWEQAFDKHLHLAETYPKSVYAPVSLYTALFRAHVIGDKNIVISACKKLIEDYPEFYYIDDTFYNLVGNYKVLQDKAGAVAYMKELIEKHPNTKISEKAEYWLERIEEWEFE
jgi:hypothetical protein